MRALLLVLSFLQVALLAPARMAPGHCSTHAPGARAVAHDARHHGADERLAPARGGDCDHCPPADCARHQACTQAAAVVAEVAPLDARRPAAASSHVSPPELISADPSPPEQPPRLNA